jgi:hypothetical protein
MKKLSRFRYCKTSPEVIRLAGVSPISDVAAAGRSSAFDVSCNPLQLQWWPFGSDNRLQYDIAGTLGNGTWGCIVDTYDKDVGANNQRL